MIYICGDSFCVSDQDYDYTPWTEQVDAVSLGSVCASNQLIALQVEHAIAQQAKFIIVEFTSVTRNIVQFADKKQCGASAAALQDGRSQYLSIVRMR